MKDLLKKLWPLIKYTLFSCMTATIEVIIGLLLIHLLKLSEVPANTVGMIIGASVHYLCVTASVFKSGVNWKTVAVYVSTFLFGMLLQNTILWIGIRLIGDALSEDLRYLCCKGCSLVTSFFILYFIRKYCYRRVSEGAAEKKEAMEGSE